MSKEVICPECGTVYQGDIVKCEVCGWSPYKRIRLIGASGERSFGSDMRIGRALIRSMCGDEDSRFADSTEQFSISLQEDKQWSLKPGKGKNPTFLNGVRLTGPIVVNTNDIISIGAIRARMTILVE